MTSSDKPPPPPAHPLSSLDQMLDVRWRERFGQPLPVIGCPEIALAILEQSDAAAPRRGRVARGRY